jgi:hypothetical protein
MTEEQDYWTANNLIKPASRIVCAAMYKEGRIICGARHFDAVMRQQMEASEGIKWWRSCKQGFINQFGEFLTREEAYIIALEQGQIYRPDGGSGDKKTLYSEMCY